ncbi:MAG: hypothetical protein FD143_2248 [Ignavibacteria bacterium]|nr:MAG: hypothetical protein FD143_2248 [Ignavibacteria bacterium]KAF0158533.1 MAG: hypothetical protein FD188_2533 [Ignavibacteria bacterium]
MLERLFKLETNIGELEKFQQKYQIDDLKNDLQVQWILRYGLFESIQIVIDISCHLAAKYNLGNAQTYSDCISLLKKEKYLSGEISERLLGMIGLRNILIHEYVAVDIGMLFGLLNHLDDFRQFASEIKDVV